LKLKVLLLPEKKKSWMNCFGQGEKGKGSCINETGFEVIGIEFRILRG